MEQMTTKERILQAALGLFSEKGYDGVGVDLIGETVGMKGPSLYKHFKGKEAILDALIDQVSAHYEAGFGSAASLQNYPQTLQEMAEMTLGRLNFTIHDEQVRKVRKMLTMEQFRNPKLKILTTRHFQTGIEEMYKAFFESLIRNGKVKPFDPALLAFEFTAPITILIHRIDREPDFEPEAMKLIRKHMDHFVEMYQP